MPRRKLKGKGKFKKQIKIEHFDKSFGDGKSTYPDLYLA